ncbi:MAG TPA: hypothetical protein VL171_00015 [Verrucomicrobiae bacterium]|nr:hypothetical protein [Verrucomicrobiae bacterium]
MEFPPLDFRRIRTYPIRERPNKVHLAEMARVWKKGDSFAQFMNSLPRILVGNDFRAVVDATVAAVRNKKPVVVMMGAHTIKCGLNPIFIDLMKRGGVSAVALNGAGAIHDFELAYMGETSEDVQRGLDDGSFGMIDETGRLMNQALAAGMKQGIGAGRALGEMIVGGAPGMAGGGFRNKELSLLHQGVISNVPVTVHIAIGTDIIHQHPTADGSALGEASYLDFQKVAAIVAQLEGGIVFNIGSAVVLPEVFLKALTIARNLGNTVNKFTTVNFDMIHQYRPTENVIRRPTHKGGRGYSIIGHHELLVPLWAAATLEQLA